MTGDTSQTLLGRYRLEEAVGVGGMGTVVRAHDEVLHRTVAIKLLKDELAHDPNTVERFRREARIAASLSHPGIAQVYDFGEEDGRSFIVMEFLEGEDLQSLLTRTGPLPAPRAAEIVARAADALDHAHRSGAVHRDVKPGNIFLTQSGEVKVTDFGIARAASEAPVTAIGTILGTFLYLSPEQANGDPATPAADIYSLGCVLFHLLAGQPPFEGDSPPAIAMAHLLKTPERLGALNPETPEALEKVVARALEKQPERRFPTAGAMAMAAREAVGSGAIASAGELASAGQSTAGNQSSQSEAPTLIARTAAGRDKTRILEAGRDQETPRELEAAVAENRPQPERPRISARRGKRARRRPVLAVVALALAILAVVLAAGRPREVRPVQVPKFAAMRIEDARAEARKVGLELDEVKEPSARPPGEVLRQNPASGTQVPPGSRITVYVATDEVEVPAVEGLDLDEAKQTLEGVGLEPKEARRVQGEKDDVVVAQDPKAGTIVVRGSEVRLTISERKGRGKDRGED